MKKCKLYVMCGIPGAGKSTFLKTIAKDQSAVISRDAIRFSLVREDEEYFSREKEVFNEFIHQIKQGINFNSEVYVDATHINELSRAKLLRSLGTSLIDVEVNAIVIPASLETALEQNENRKGTRGYVPREVIRRMSSQFTYPTKEEGFENIYILHNDKKECERREI